MRANRNEGSGAHGSPQDVPQMRPGLGLTCIILLLLRDATRYGGSVQLRDWFLQTIDGSFGFMIRD